MKTSLISKSVQAMKGYVPGEQPADKTIIKLNTNENPYPPSPKVFQALKEMDAARLRLYPNPVGQKLRERIAQMHGCEVENVFAGNGSDEILALCTRAFVENNGSIGYFNPSYSLYPVLADIRNARKRPVELCSGFEWRMPAGYRSSLFFLTNPNAPTSMLYPRSKVRSFCARFKGVVLIDEAYVDFSRENCMDLSLEFGNVLVLRTLSKSYSLAGIRAGYTVGAKPLIEALFKIKDSYNLDAVTQQLALAALNDVGYMRKNVARIKAMRLKMSRALAQAGHMVCPSETNFLWVRPAGITAKQFFERLRENHILVRYFPGQRTGDFVRITIGTEKEVDRLIEAVSRFD